jgi:hypothetical protein
MDCMRYAASGGSFTAVAAAAFGAGPNPAFTSATVPIETWGVHLIPQSPGSVTLSTYSVFMLPIGASTPSGIIPLMGVGLCPMSVGTK